MSLLPILCLALARGTAPADDIVAAFRHVANVQGAYRATDAGHLYRLSADGKAVKQLTFGQDEDSDPRLTPDKTQILFWRRPPLDVAGGLRLCSIRPDGTHFKVIGSYTDIPPADLPGQELIDAFPRPYVPTLKFDREELTLQIVKGPLSAGEERAHGIVSPSGRYEIIDGVEADSFVADLMTGKTAKLPGIPSSAGGTESPENLSWLTDDSLTYSFYEDADRLAIVSIAGRVLSKLMLHEKGGEPVDMPVDTQRQVNEHGAKSFVLAGGLMLLQRVGRDETGGDATVYWVRTGSGLVVRQVAHQFLQDVDSARTRYLSTGWHWGKHAEGAVPVAPLYLWDVRRGADRVVGPLQAQCLGACFVPAGGPR